MPSHTICLCIICQLVTVHICHCIIWQEICIWPAFYWGPRVALAGDWWLLAHAPITQVHSFKPQSRCTFIILPICLQLQEIEDWLKHFLVNCAAPPPERVLGWWLGVLASAKEAAASVIWEFMELATSSLWPGRIYERISIWQLPRPAPGPTMLPQTVIWADRRRCRQLLR